METDHQRIDALRQGIAAAATESYVAIAVRDLQWLLDQIDPPHTPNNQEGEEPDVE